MCGCRLTVKLRGRAEAPAIGAEGAQFPSARGGNTEAPHGPLQRLLEDALIEATVRAPNWARKPKPQAPGSSIASPATTARAGTPSNEGSWIELRAPHDSQNDSWMRPLTVKLRGRTEAPDRGAEGAQFLGARGAKPQAHHGPLQRLLAGATWLRLGDEANAKYPRHLKAIRGQFLRNRRLCVGRDLTHHHNSNKSS